MRRFAVLVLIPVFICAVIPAFAQDSTQSETTNEPPSFGFGLGLGLGVQSFENPDGTVETWQMLGLKPDFSFGKLGVGLDLTINYRFTGGDGNDFEVRKDDWVPTGDTNFFELYLPKIQYIRWGMKGDPLFVKLGSIEDATLGNGFIMGNYANTLFLPDRRIFGLALDVDGKLFNFPYIGMESFIANLAAYDVMGSRLYVRPLAGTEIPVLKELQLGGTAVTDLNPYYYADKDPAFTGTVDNRAEVLVWGADFRLPIIARKALSLATFGDFVSENQNYGGMVGLGGRIIKILTYGAQIRFIGDNFIPVYFDSTYDLSRVSRYDVYNASTTVIESYIGWLASAGFSLFDDTLVFNTSLEGPFGNPAGVEPTLRGSLLLAQGLVPHISLQGNYVKQDIGSFSDLGSARDAVIGAQINYQTGPAVISLIYDLKYDPYATGSSPWVVTSRLESTISLY